MSSTMVLLDYWSIHLYTRPIEITSESISDAVQYCPLNSAWIKLLLSFTVKLKHSLYAPGQTKFKPFKLGGGLPMISSTENNEISFFISVITCWFNTDFLQLLLLPY